MEKISSYCEYVPLVQDILGLVAHPDAIKKVLGYLPDRFVPKSRIVRKAVLEVLVGKCTLHNTVYMSPHGDIVCIMFLDHPRGTRRTTFTKGLVLAHGLKELPFKNIWEQKDAMDTAVVIYHYWKEFQHYECSAGK
mgnify:CR=1 FL=1